jgi:hypothetical protein
MYKNFIIKLTGCTTNKAKREKRKILISDNIEKKTERYIQGVNLSHNLWKYSNHRLKLLNECSFWKICKSKKIHKMQALERTL